MLYNSAGGALSNAIHEVHLQGLSSSTVEQQINNAHFAVALGANTQQKYPKKNFLLSQ